MAAQSKFTETCSKEESVINKKKSSPQKKQNEVLRLSEKPDCQEKYKTKLAQA